MGGTAAAAAAAAAATGSPPGFSGFISSSCFCSRHLDRAQLLSRRGRRTDLRFLPVGFPSSPRSSARFCSSNEGDTPPSADVPLRSILLFIFQYFLRFKFFVVTVL